MKIMIITGASRGIGYALASYFSQHGYKVYGLSRSFLPNQIFETLVTDITQKNEVETSINTILLKEGKIDVLINNAGKGMVGAIEDATETEILDLFKLNLLACVHVMAAVLPSMRENNRGTIINISSIGSEMGLPFRGYYSASKAALDKITEAIRMEVGSENILITALHLGDIQTKIAENRIQSTVSESYKNSFEKVYAGMNAHVNQGVLPETLAPFIKKLLTKKKLKPHYYFGKWNQKMGIVLKKFLPQLAFERLMKKYADL